ncbi:MAG: (2Fe-2S)-binding protein [Acidobacteria bacterium]|nr:(2Fe-2S)-binding protein [Acidobacteriota bacterium]
MSTEERSGTDMFAPYKNLVRMVVDGRECRVPENNSVLRCLQYVAMDAISEAELCWNGDCLNCKVWIAEQKNDKAAIACRHMVSDGMKITKLSEHLEEAMKDAFTGDDDVNILEL